MDRRDFLYSITSAALASVGNGLIINGVAKAAVDPLNPRRYSLFGIPPVPQVGDEMLLALNLKDGGTIMLAGCVELDAPDDFPAPLEAFRCVSVDEKHGRLWGTFVHTTNEKFARLRVREDGHNENGKATVMIDFVEVYQPKQGEFSGDFQMPFSGVKNSNMMVGFAEAGWPGSSPISDCPGPAIQF